ncbi:tyrosine--tRNA ligase [bacterium SCSIO 12643]|nr:tyrosine--tRNA ligase [bacterium SCSIO 12643]
MDLVKELTWRGLIHDIMPGTEELLQKEMVTGYAGFDPTADSLHIGNLVPIMLLVHLQRAGHKPIALVGGATGMIGDPSGKSSERNLLDLDVMNQNLEAQKKQLQQFLDFDCGENSASVVNNYDWFKDMNFLSFIRDTGKHITVNYMMSKDSVKNRLAGEGMSFTEFTYQLIQGYDFYHLYTNQNCKLQIGGSDQWGNIVTGTELIRRKAKGEGFALTAPLIKKADGSKFGKSEGGNVWLDAKKTSPYKFYQYWLNSSDEDAKNYIKVFTLLSEGEINELIAEHDKAPHARQLQKKLGEEITKMVHSEEALHTAIEASNILFGKATSDSLKKLSEDDFLSVFDGVPQGTLSAYNVKGILDVLVESGFLKSRGEARRALKENSISVNKEKINESFTLSDENLIQGKYILLQRGKKNYFLIKI